MQITVTFDSLEEFRQYLQLPAPEPVPEAAPVVEEKPKRGRPKKAEEPEPVPFEEPAGPQPVTLTDVRAVALKFSKAGKQAELKEAFGKFGAKKLSDVPADQYPALMEELMKIDA